MLKYILILFGLTLSVNVTGQNIPTGVTAPSSATAKKLPAAYSTAPTNNYQRVFVPQVPLTDSSLINMSSTVENVITSITYMDTYGRPVETITRKTSPDKKDNVAANWYDEFGRSTIGYLPYAATTDDGLFKTNPFQQDSTFYKTQFPNEHINYTQALYDGSPLNIPVKYMSQGNSWGGAGTGINYGHRSNTVSDSVVLWTVAISSEDDVPVKTAFYLPGTLAVKEITDERGIKVIQYSNEKGQTVLTKSQLASSPGTAHTGWLCTYYVYDEMGQLRLVIPPKAVEAINNISLNWSLSATPAINTDLCFAYFYDDRGRCIMKRIPGKGKSYTAYDLYNRVVMTTDPRLKAEDKWAYVIYDAQSRPVTSGIITTSLIKDSIITQAGRSLAYPGLSGATYTSTSQTYYDNYDWIAGSGTSLTGSLTTTHINGTNFFTTYNTSPDYAQQVTASSRIRGRVTGSKTIILNTSNYLFSVNIYDHRGRSIQTKQINYSGGTDVATVQYDFAGRVLRTHWAHAKSGTNAQNHTVLTKYTYDHIGRVKTQVKNLNGLGDKTVLQKSYSEMGTVSAKVIGGMETQNYAYNIRGSLLSINKDHVNNTTPGAFFGEIISYDYGFTDVQLNGNKAGIKWRAAGDSNVRAYGYSYDNVNRLTNANFSQQNSGSTSWTKDKMDFSAGNFTYDANGNILTMSQRGLQISAIALIDSLKYSYFSNSNRLQKVADLSTAGGYMGDFKDSSNTNDDYTYDANGNINRDNNRKMHTTGGGAGAVFNLLDKTDSIVIAGKATTYYYYDAGGAMLGKRVNTYTGSGTVVKNYQYLNGFVYLNDTLQYVLVEGGRIRYANKKNSTTGAAYFAYEYDYFITDHMGNVRSVITEGRDTSIYKAGMEVADSSFEDRLFANVYTPVRTVVNKPAGFDGDAGNQRVARLNAAVGVNQKSGPSLLLKVMAGDKVQVSTYAFYNTATVAPDPGVNLLTEILAGLAGAVVNNSAGKLNSTHTSAVSTALSPNVNNFLTNNRPYNSARPKAYLNWILFDNQFNFVASNSGVVQVASGASKQALVPALQTIAKNGYFYVYTSNESPQDVFFDELVVKHTTGPLVQEQAYYPYGLEIQGLSDKAVMKVNNPYKYNGGSDLEDEDGIGYYSTFYRKYDAQIGRFSGIDILAEQSWSLNPFQFGANNPVLFNDPTGARQTTGTTNPASFSSAVSLIDFLLKYGTASFESQFVSWTFGMDTNGENVATSYFEGNNLQVKDGYLYYDFSYTKLNGTKSVFGNVSNGEREGESRTENTLVLGKGKMAIQNIWNNALSWGETHRNADREFFAGQTETYDVMWQHDYSVFLARKGAGGSMQRNSDRKSYTENFATLQNYYNIQQEGKLIEAVAVGIILAPVAAVEVGLAAVPIISEGSLLYNELGRQAYRIGMNALSEGKVALHILGAMGANGVIQLNQIQLLNAINSALQVGKYNNIPVLKDILRNASPLRGYFQ